MVQETVFEGIIRFLEGIGVFRVILPFILVFTIMYALLERTRVLGTDTINSVEYSKKNLNSMVAFVAGFLVIVSSELVGIINQTVGKVVLVLIMIVLILLLVGTFHKDEKKPFFFQEGGWRTFMIALSVLSVLFIFLDAIPGPDNEPSFLEWFFKYLSINWNTEWVGAIILIILIIGFMYWIQYPQKPRKSGGSTPPTTPGGVT